MLNYLVIGINKKKTIHPKTHPPPPRSLPTWFSLTLF